MEKEQKAPILVLMRHGESEWNRKNLFTGWVDVPLSRKGVEEALKAGEKIKTIPIDLIYTSTLIRAQTTTFLAMLGHESGKIPVVQHTGGGNMERWAVIHDPEEEKETIPVFYAWQLNERMYGDLQGLNKVKTSEKFGAEQVKLWRRSYSIAPPHGESLAITAGRTIPYFRNVIVGELAAGKHILIVAHGNSLRSIIMDIEGLTEEQVLQLELPTGEPRAYSYREEKFQRTPL